MGTSTRNKGQSGHTPLVPSWLEEGGDDGREGQNAGEIKAIPPDGDINRFRKLVVSGWLLKALVTGFLVFLCSYALQTPIQSFVNTFPTWLVHGFEIAGGILPAVGLGLLLMVSLNKENAPYLFLGFIMATFLDLPNVLPIAVVGVCLAYINYMHEKKVEESAAKITVNDFGGEEDGI